jgi:hypothetical protein
VINDSTRLFFLHIPKTGGTTFYRFLENNYSQQDSISEELFADLCRRSGDKEAFVAMLADVRLITRLHLGYTYVERLQAIHPQMRVATILRQPVERALSSIDHWRRVPKNVAEQTTPAEQELIADAHTMPLADFVERHREWLSDRQAKLIGGSSEGSQPVDRAELRDTSLQNLEKIDYVGVTGQILPFAAAVSHFMGFFNSMNAHRLNVSQADSRLTADERQSINGQLAELNQIDALLYQEAELRCERLSHRWKKSLYDLTTPPAPRQLPVGETAVFSMAERLVGDGWHEREGGIQAVCRWAGPQRCSSLYLAVVPVGTFTVTIWMPSVISGEVFAGMAVRVGGRLAEHASTIREGFQVVTATISVADTEAQCLHLELTFPQTASGWDVCRAADHRQKTVAVERVEVQRLS